MYIKDLFESIKNPYISFYHAKHEIKIMFRNSMLGPIWISISTLVLVICLSFIMKNLSLEISENYVAYLCLGLIIWNFISNSVNDGCSLYISPMHESYIRNFNINFFHIALKNVFKNKIIFFFNSFVYLGIHLI